MKILLVSSFLPYPLFSGGYIRLYNILKLLSKKHEIYLICEKREHQTKDDIKNVEKYCEKVITVNRKKQWSWQNIIKTGLSSNPFLITGHASNKMKKEIDGLLNREKFDLIHVETFYVMQNLPETELPIVLAEHNIEYLVYKRFANKAFLPIRALLYIDILKLKYWEEKCWRKVKKLLAVSEVDKKIMSKKRKNVELVPNGVDIKKFKVQSPIQSGTKFKVNIKEQTILFIGDFRWLENRDAVEWILKEIWPKIKMSFWSEGEARAIESHQRKKDVIALLQHDARLRLWIVGRNIPDSVKKLPSDKSVIFDENAPNDTTLIYQKSDILLAPIRVGGGTSFKILEAMASGVPVITTSFGNEGIGAEENKEVLIAYNASDFAKKTIDVLSDKKLYEKIAANARKFIEVKYDWEKIVRKLEEVYEEAISRYLK